MLTSISDVNSITRSSWGRSDWGGASRTARGRVVAMVVASLPELLDANRTHGASSSQNLLCTSLVMLDNVLEVGDGLCA